ncbi:esterase [Bizionia gelidisalsuginis]|uniref:Esterase n=2 Tax=Bizionia TaxID=283785 RepID=A0A8H2LCG7_9FLAO|nr:MULTISPECIES: esterase [Bizionia]TYB73074.1 esterase [Bizionia saleffrena]TYC14844.1 esterase [Bizionia gelidisalsuginis]
MNSTEKEISYVSKNSYSTLNTLTENTKNVWFVCHGMGYLSRYFIKYFSQLNPEENYIIAPQAQSKYYQSKNFKHVGASWLTKENTAIETENIYAYFNAVLKAEQLPDNINLLFFGYSQGVSVAARYLVKNKLQCAQLVLHSGGIPKELTPDDFSYLDENTRVTLIYGTEDEYLNETRIKEELHKAETLFGNRLQILPFKGKHVVSIKLINALV